MIKYGLIRDRDFLAWLRLHLPELVARNGQSLAYAIDRSCRNKAEVVAADERESGERALLNLGHTFGHAIETGLGYGVWLHGEAVAAGMCMAADLSARLGWLTADDVAEVDALIGGADLPTRVPQALAPDRMLELMAVDKKAKDGRIRLVLLKELGRAVVSSDYDPDALAQTLAECRAAVPAVREPA